MWRTAIMVCLLLSICILLGEGSEANPIAISNAAEIEDIFIDVDIKVISETTYLNMTVSFVLVDPDGG